MTDDYAVDVLPGELIAWARSARGDKTPEIIVNAEKEYRVQTDYDRQAFEIGEHEDLSLVSITGTLTIEPSGDGGGWILELRAEDTVGLLPPGMAGDCEDEIDMTVDAFVEQFLAPEKSEVEIILHAPDPAAADRFQHWLAQRRER